MTKLVLVGKVKPAPTVLEEEPSYYVVTDGNGHLVAMTSIRFPLSDMQIMEITEKGYEAENVSLPEFIRKFHLTHG